MILWLHHAITYIKKELEKKMRGEMNIKTHKNICSMVVGLIPYAPASIVS